MSTVGVVYLTFEYIDGTSYELTVGIYNENGTTAQYLINIMGNQHPAHHTYAAQPGILEFFLETHDKWVIIASSFLLMKDQRYRYLFQFPVSKCKSSRIASLTARNQTSKEDAVPESSK
jgi:hypothetical protein